MTFKLSSQNVSSVSDMRIKKHLVILYAQLWSEAVFHREGAKSAKKDFIGFFPLRPWRLGGSIIQNSFFHRKDAKNAKKSFFVFPWRPWRFKKNAQMPFKLSSQNVSIVSGMRIKK
ncbi:MAG TPA: hypothetical protein ENJ29_02010, partial [Bacteroidetes bacterium]|nr:hypothetical protein [Bacteroidota bacterium]